MKKQFYYSILIALIALVYTGCSKDEKEKEDEGPAEIAVSDYPSYFPGAWKDSYAMRYYCTDNTFYIDFNNGNSASGTWSLSQKELTMEYSSGETYMYSIEYMLEDEYEIVDQETSSTFTASLESEDGCYWLPVEEYAEALPGKWNRDDGTQYWYCDDNTYYIEEDDGRTWSGQWYFEDNMLIRSSLPDREVIHMSSNEFIESHTSGDEYRYVLSSSDGCYEPPMGSVAFYIEEDCGCGSIDVSINGTEMGTIESYITSGSVTCGTDGTLTLDLEPGTYDVYAECSGLYWEFTTEVTDGGCTTELLSCNKAMAK